MIFGLLGALVAALAYGGATIVQAIGVARMREAHDGADLITRARFGWLYGVGLALDGVAFLASSGALRTLPLFLVQSVIAGSVAVTAVLAVVVLHAKLTRREIMALVGVGVGLVMLAVCAKEGHATGVPTWLAPAALVVAALLVPFGYTAYRARNSALLAVTAGLGFAGIAIGARILPWDGNVLHTIASWPFWVLIAHGIIAMTAYGFALDAGEATSVAAITFAPSRRWCPLPSASPCSVTPCAAARGRWPSRGSSSRSAAASSWPGSRSPTRKVVRCES